MAKVSIIDGKIIHETERKVTRKDYADYIYEIVRLECEGMDSVYADFIEHLVGSCGLNILREFNMVESCGVINGRKLYVLCGKTE